MGQWVTRQRVEYKDSQLSDERIGLLNDTQFVWKCNNNDASTSLRQKDWDVMLGLVKDYKEIYGDATIPQGRVHQERAVGKWLSTQREQARLGRLHPLRALRLES